MCIFIFGRNHNIYPSSTYKTYYLEQLFEVVGGCLESTIESLLIKVPLLFCRCPRYRCMGWLRLVGSRNYRSLLQNIVSFVGLFCKRDL